MLLFKWLIYWVQIILDWVQGVDFATNYENIPKDVGYRYQATSPRVYWGLRRLIKKQTDVKLLDVGCGKGRMLRFFSNCGVSVVDGIEYSEELVSICKKNMEKLGIKANVFQGDAAKFEHYESYNYFYLFNPFGEEVMKGFLQRIIESYYKVNREITIIYLNPKFGFLLEEAGMKRANLMRGICVFTFGKNDE